MVTDIQNINADVLERELQWLEIVIITRLNIYLKQDCGYTSVFEVVPPFHAEQEAPYAKFIEHYNMDSAERLAFALAITPHIQPALLDHFFFKNNEHEHGYTVFGGLKAVAHGGFVPTGETLLFLLAGNDLKQRFTFMQLLQEGHFFSAHHILTLMPAPNNEPMLSGALKLSEELIDQFTTGQATKPNFSMNFPAKLITTELVWEDLVLPTCTHEQIDEIKTWVAHSHILMNEWGVAKKLKPGLKSLFYGPPGSGKTLTACLLGKQCGMDVHRIDLSMMTSKYIGETEKNLSKIFDMAEDKN